MFHLLMIIVIFLIAVFDVKHTAVGGMHTVWFDPKTFVQGQGAWQIGQGLQPTTWQTAPTNRKQWLAALDHNYRDGLCLANTRVCMKFVDAKHLPQLRETQYLRDYHVALDTLKGVNGFLMTPYLREWQRQHLWQWIPQHARLLDIGVGTGRSRDLWQHKQLQVWGVEPNPRNIDELAAKHLPQVQGLQPWPGQDPRIQTWLPKKHMNVVMMCYSITFFFESSHTLQALIDNIEHALARGGTFVLIGMDGEKIDRLLGSDKKLDNACYTINKRYDKLQVFGSEIEITMKNPHTLVQAQREYLVDFPTLKMRLHDKKFKCVCDKFVTSTYYLDHWPAAFVEAQRLLVFTLD